MAHLVAAVRDVNRARLVIWNTGPAGQNRRSRLAATTTVPRVVTSTNAAAATKGTTTTHGTTTTTTLPPASATVPVMHFVVFQTQQVSGPGSTPRGGPLPRASGR
jgi:hypothetical protein